jgi:transglutaminase-like putative cysteine protease
LPQDSHAGRTGLAEEMQPGSLGELSESEAIAFRATVLGRVPRARELYWRALVLWDTDGRRWTRGARLAGSDRLVAAGDALRYTVLLEPSDKPWLPVLDLPRAAPPGARMDYGYTVARREPIRDRVSYTVDSVLEYRTAELPASVRQRALALPARRAARARALAAGWRAQHPDDGAVVQAALRHFRDQPFSYTLAPPRLGADPVDEFLFETRRGYCEHYTAAFVTLMRAAGVPARVVLGYQGGEYSTAGGYYVVQQADAHAWAEVWLAGSGWVRIDPTAAVAPERIELGGAALRRLAARGIAPGSLPADAWASALALGVFERAARFARNYWDLADVTWYTWVAGYDQALQAEFLGLLGMVDVSTRSLVWLLAVVSSTLLLVYALWLLALRPRRDPVQALYARYCHKLARVGLERHPQEGPMAYAARCRARRPALTATIDRVTALYVSIRYGGGAQPGHLRALASAVAGLRV